MRTKTHPKTLRRGEERRGEASIDINILTLSGVSDKSRYEGGLVIHIKQARQAVQDAKLCQMPTIYPGSLSCLCHLVFEIPYLWKLLREKQKLRNSSMVEWQVLNSELIILKWWLTRCRQQWWILWLLIIGGNHLFMFLRECVSCTRLVDGHVFADLQRVDKGDS